MSVCKSSDLRELTAETPESQSAVDQLVVTRPQDFGRVFLPGADQEMAEAIASIVTTEGDVQAAMDGLKETLEGIYAEEIEPKLEEGGALEGGGPGGGRAVRAGAPRAARRRAPLPG